jgi:hypothetical protein
LDRRTWDAFSDEHGDLGIQIVAHEIELVPADVFDGVDSSFRRWQDEDQPSMAGINGGKAEDIPEK